jgi:tyrosine-protein kinase Etk/Wzc
MQNNNTEFKIQEDSDQTQGIQRLLFRVLPFWPLILLALFLGYAGARIYLRYAVKARVIVNDDSQQKSGNLVDIMQLDTRNMSTETEKEMEILRSRDLLGKLAKKLQLNIQYTSKGYIKSSDNYGHMPFQLELEQPDSVKTGVAGNVHFENGHINFNNVLYPIDTLVQSKFGKIIWHTNSEGNKNLTNNEWYLTIQPIPQTVSQIQSSLSIDPITKQSSIVVITYRDKIPERALNILTNLLSLYGSTTIDYKSRISENTMRFLDERLKLVSDDLSGIEKNLQNFKSSNDIIDLSSQGTQILGKLQETDAKVSELDVQMDVLNKIKDYVTKRNNSNSQIPATLGIADPVVTDLLNQLYQAEFELQKVQETSGSKNPKIEVLQQTIDKLKPGLLTSINNLKTSLQLSRQRLQADNDKLNVVLDKMPVKERQLLDISRQQGIKNGIYTYLLQKREEAAIGAAAIVSNYRLLDKPETAGIVKPEPLKINIGSLFAAMLLLSLYIYLKEFSSMKLKFRSQIESGTKVPILAEIGFQKHKNNSPIVIEEGKRTLVAEEFRELRTNLNYVTFKTKNSSKVILITSSIPGEGKSFVSINTSISLCLTGSKVVLLEFDLRKPKISKELGINRNPGLSTYFIGKATANEIVQSHATIANFSIIPSGPIPPNPSELISNERLNELFDYLKQHFDYIIVDSPPVGAVTDAKILANVADATLYIMRQNYTHNSFLKLINEVQQKEMLPNVNIVFNGIKVKSIPGYKYGNSYGYGYKYGYGGYYSDDDSRKGKSFWRMWR